MMFCLLCGDPRGGDLTILAQPWFALHGFVLGSMTALRVLRNARSFKINHLLEGLRKPGTLACNQ